MQRDNEERKFDFFDRLKQALIVLIPWSIIGTGTTGVLGECFVAVILVFAAEFSFEIYEGKVCIRACGKRQQLGKVGQILWIILKPLDLMGQKNFPIGAVVITLFFAYMVLIRGFQFLDVFVHFLVLWYLYYMRKVNK